MAQAGSQSHPIEAPATDRRCPLAQPDPEHACTHSSPSTIEPIPSERTESIPPVAIPSATSFDVPSRYSSNRLSPMLMIQPEPSLLPPLTIEPRPGQSRTGARSELAYQGRATA